MSANDQHIELLQELIVTCRDGQIGYQHAAAHTNDPALKALFDGKSLERAQFAGELEQEVQRLGKHDPKREGSIAGLLQRAWFDMAAGPLGGGDASIVEGVEGGETQALNVFRKAAAADLPGNLKEIVERQLQSIVAAHNEVSKLRRPGKGAMIV